MKVKPIAFFLIATTLTAWKLSGMSFGEDVEFLKKHTPVVLLSSKEGAQVVIAPALQGRVMTSTAGGPEGSSYGWINRELFDSGKVQPHINVFGGEDRFWMGPEGGQFSIFFGKGAAFDLEHWFTPASFDTEPFEQTAQARDHARFHRSFQLTNFSGTVFAVGVDREIRLLSSHNAWKRLDSKPAAGVKLVAYESVNRIRNAGKEPWRKETGLLSIWILGMFNPSPATTIVVPIKLGSENDLGKPVNSDYFGAVPAERLAVKDGVVLFSGDGKFRSKIGINPKRCRSVLGSYDSANRTLTIVQFTFHEGQSDYVNSMWKLQDHPYAGDVANAYNDGPPAPGAKPLGPFYELESSSPAAPLAPGRSLEHIHRTIHLSGGEAELDRIAQQILGVSLREITTALPRN